MAGKLSSFAGMHNAYDFAYGINPRVPPLQVVAPSPGVSGSQTMTVAFDRTNLSDGTLIYPLATTAPVNIGANSAMETVTPSSVSVPTPNQYSTCTFTATFSNAHGNGDQVSSGTVGLQEALNYASSKGGGTVIIDAAWVAAGGTQAMVAAATYPAGVGFWDNRTGADFTNYSYTLSNAQILALSTTSVSLLPAPGANSYWSVSNAALVNVNAGTAFTGGGAITIGYGTSAATVIATTAVSATVAASFLTTPTATTIIQVGQGLTAATAGTLVLNKPLGIANASAAFAAGTGATVQVNLQVANILT